MSQQDATRFYTDLFTRAPSHSTRYPNRNESRRLASICAYLSDVALSSASPRPLRIMDLGCFVRQIKELLACSGHLILTTPRGKYYQKWLPLDYPRQPVEAWLTERELRDLLQRHGFKPLRQDRIYSPQPAMSLLHRLCASPKLPRALNTLRLTWFHQGLQYAAALYQTWLFQIPNTQYPIPTPRNCANTRYIVECSIN